jgi:hypothetical protein
MNEIKKLISYYIVTRFIPGFMLLKMKLINIIKKDELKDEHEDISNRQG